MGFGGGASSGPQYEKIISENLGKQAYNQGVQFKPIDPEGKYSADILKNLRVFGRLSPPKETEFGQIVNRWGDTSREGIDLFLMDTSISQEAKDYVLNNTYINQDGSYAIKTADDLTAEEQGIKARAEAGSRGLYGLLRGGYSKFSRKVNEGATKAELEIPLTREQQAEKAQQDAANEARAEAASAELDTLLSQRTTKRRQSQSTRRPRGGARSNLLGNGSSQKTLLGS